jgi:hypothetical protein
MRRFVMLLLVMLLVAPISAARAQEHKLLWDLTETMKVTDLGFKFMYPKGWVYDTKAGIKLAETKGDLELSLDDDPKTNPEGYTITLAAFTFDDLKLEKDATLEDTMDAALKLTSITADGDPFELPVLTRRSLTIFGTSAASKRPGLLTVWKQGEFVVLFGIGMPEASSDANYSWGNILGTVQPIEPLKLSKETLTVSKAKINIAYPDGWTEMPNESGKVVLENEKDKDDLAHPTGYVIVVLELATDDLKSMLNLEVESPDDLVKLIETLQPHDDVTVTEHIILNQPARTVRGADKKNKGYWGYITAFTINDTAVIAGVVAPSEEKLNEIEQTWLQILNTIRPSEKE